MSWHSYTATCPVCWEETLNVSSDSKPFDTIDSSCKNCGFYTYTSSARSSLEDFLYEAEEDFYDNREDDNEEFDKQAAIDRYHSFTKDFEEL